MRRMSVATEPALYARNHHSYWNDGSFSCVIRPKKNGLWRWRLWAGSFGSFLAAGDARSFNEARTQAADALPGARQ